MDEAALRFVTVFSITVMIAIALTFLGIAFWFRDYHNGLESDNKELTKLNRDLKRENVALLVENNRLRDEYMTIRARFHKIQGR
jgi:Tfp pilus assembly protein PilO